MSSEQASSPAQEFPSGKNRGAGASSASPPQPTPPPPSSLLPIFHGLVIVIPTFTQSSDHNSDTVVRYDVVCHSARLGLRWALRRRYSEFECLHHHLTMLLRLHGLQHRNLASYSLHVHAGYGSYVHQAAQAQSLPPSLRVALISPTALTSPLHHLLPPGECSCGDVVLPPFPPKARWSLFTRHHTNADRAAVELRRQQLEAYLQNVVNKVAQLPSFAAVLADFLGMKAPDFQPLLVQAQHRPPSSSSSSRRRKPPSNISTTAAAVPPPRRPPPLSPPPPVMNSSLLSPFTLSQHSPAAPSLTQTTHNSSLPRPTSPYLHLQASSSPKVELMQGTMDTPAIYVSPPRP